MFKRSTSVVLIHTWSLLVTSIVAVGCAAGVDANEPVASTSEALSAKSLPPIPSALVVPDGNRLAFKLDAVGVQMYGCQLTTSGSYAWVLSGPDANLYGRGGRLAGAHYASPTGPTWESLDGSAVIGSRLAAATVDTNAIPWLLLQAISHSGDGRMSKVTYIQRLSTTGGKAPASGCDADHVGSVANVDYTATYAFYRASCAQEAVEGRDD
jgi:hypothetical protein